MSIFQHKFSDEKKSAKEDLKNINLNRLPVSLILDGLTDIGNIGMIFRIADALRIEKVYFYNYNKEFNRNVLMKKSRSTVKYVDFEYIDNFEELIKLKEKSKLIVLDKTNRSIPYSRYEYAEPVCLIIGAERTGVSADLINISDLSLHLPMNGINTSINVATAASAVLYDLYNKINIK